VVRFTWDYINWYELKDDLYVKIRATIEWVDDDNDWISIKMEKYDDDKDWTMNKYTWVYDEATSTNWYAAYNAII